MIADNERDAGTFDGFRDEALVDAARNGEERAFACLVRRYLRRAMAVALEFTDVREDAEDIVQDTFRRVLDNLGRFDTGRTFQPWFYTILRNTARNAARHRRARAHEPLDEAHAASGPGPFEDAHRTQLRNRISGALDRLPPMQRSCFRLCTVEGLTSVEAGEALGLSESTVRVHVFNARKTLRDLLEAWRDEVTEA